MVKAAVDALVHQVKEWEDEREGLVVDRDIHIEKSSEGKVLMRYGFSHFGEIDKKPVDTIKAVLADHESRLKNIPELTELRKLVARLAVLGKSIREVLTTILLRRILPGKCKYCPL